MITLSDLYHFDHSGWCILADISEPIEGISELEFMTLETESGLPRVFFARKDGLSRSEQACSVRYDESDGMVKPGDSVFYFVNQKDIAGNQYQCGRVRFGKVTSINQGTGNVVIDHEITIKLLSVMQFEHNFEEIEGTDCYICDKCRAIHTGKKLAV